MKKISGFFFAFVFSITCFAINPVKPDNPRAEDIMVPLLGSEQNVSLAEYVSLTPAGYKALTGKKLTLKEKLSLKILQRHYKKAIKKDGTVNMERFTKRAADAQSFNIGWFFLGFFLGGIGLIISLLIEDEKKKARVKWTAIGWASALLVVLILLVAAGGYGY